MEKIRSTASLGAVVRAARLGLGWSQQQAADAAGVSRRFVNMLEGGEHRNAELWRVLALLEALGIELVASAPGSSTSVPPQVHVAAADAFDLDRHLAEFRKDDGS